MNRIVSRFVNSMDRVVSFLIGILHASLLLIVVSQVITRSLYISVSWTEEVAMFILCYLVFLGAAIGFKNRDHFSMQVILARLPARLSRHLSIVNEIILVLILIIMTWSGIQFFLVGMNGIFPVTLISKAWLYVILPITSLIMLFFTVINLKAELRKRDRSDSEAG